MPGSPEAGDMSLQIKNLTLADSGVYECQVAPVPSGHHRLLRRKTTLEVTGKSNRCKLEPFKQLSNDPFFRPSPSYAVAAGTSVV